MYSLLVLGLVPGTDIQITFDMWLQCVEALVLAFLLGRIGLRYVRSGRRGLLAKSEVTIAQH